MKLVIDNQVLSKLKLSLQQFVFLLHLNAPISDDEIKDLAKKGYININNRNLFEGVQYHLMDNQFKLLEEAIAAGSDDTEEKDRIMSLTLELRKLYPKGMKPGTNYYWRGNVKEIYSKLMSFTKRYGEYSNEQIIEATKQYLEKYQYDTKFMQLLTYFISKREPNGEMKSDLANHLENAGQENSGGELKTSKLI